MLTEQEGYNIANGPGPQYINCMFFGKNKNIKFVEVHRHKEGER